MLRKLLSFLLVSGLSTLAKDPRQDDLLLRQQFFADLLLLSNEGSYPAALDYWRRLFSNDSIIEINDRVITGSESINAFIDTLHRKFSRIAFVINPSSVGHGGSSQSILASHSDAEPGIDIGEYGGEFMERVLHTQTDDYRILSSTLLATFVPKNTELNCVSAMRMLSLVWFTVDKQRVGIQQPATKAVSTKVKSSPGVQFAHRFQVKKWMMTSNKNLLDFEEELLCNWIAPKSVIDSQIRRLFTGMYRDADIDSMIVQLYDTSAELLIGGEPISVGHNEIAEWFAKWPKLGVNSVFHELDELDVIGNTVVIKAISLFAHESGLCAEYLPWYGYLRFNGHGLIVRDQRFHNADDYKSLVRVLQNCGDLSPLAVESETAGGSNTESTSSSSVSSNKEDDLSDDDDHSEL